MHTLVVTNQEGATQAIARGIDRALSSNLKVLWLLSGGSNIGIELEVLTQLAHATPQNLTISLIDERLVPLGHKDSNWSQLRDGGLDDAKATLLPPVIEPGLALDAAAADFSKRLEIATNQANVVIAQFGIGPDGHTAGILPHTPGVHEQTLDVIGYKAKDFKRLTATPAFFKKISLAIVVAMGESKKPVLERMSTTISAEEQPAQLLLGTNELIIYTDQQVTWQ